MDTLHYALSAMSVILLVLLIVALNARDRMKLTAESAIMRNTELNEQLGEAKKLAQNRLETSTAYSNKIGVLESSFKDLHTHLDESYARERQANNDRDQFKALAEEGERTIQDQAKQIKELTEGDASGEVGRGKRGRFVSKKAS